MALLNGEILWHLFWIVPIFVILFFAAWKRRKSLLSLYLGKRAEDPSFVTLSPSARFWRMICLLLVLLFLFLAASRPFWGNRIMPYAGEGRDLLIVFDVSKSMLAQDVRPSRLEHAKYLVRELVKLNPGDRFGLIAFAGKAFLECPMTMDKTSFLQNVDDLSTASIPVGGTNIEEALKTALAAFKAAESSHLAVILITDGDELTGESSRVLEEAIRRKIPLFIAGIGDPSEPAIIQLPDEKGNLKTLRDEKGNIVNSRLNEKQLSHLAARTGGIYVRSSTTSTGLAQLENRIRSLDRYVRESGKQYRPIERPLYPLAAALFFLFLFFLIPERRRRSAAKVLLLSAGLFLLGSGEGLFAQENGNVPASAPGLSLPAQGQGPTLQSVPPLPAEQVRKQESAALPESKDPYVLYEAAHKAHFEEKDLAKAEKLYFLAINSASDKEKIRSGASLNLGVIRHTAMRQDAAQSRALLQKQDLQKSLEKIKEAIRKTEAIQELYKYGLLGATREKAAVNQQILLNEKREAEKLQKRIEELLKKQQQAQKNTQKALDKQQQQNKDQQKQEQKQQQSKDQQKQQQNKDQQKQEQKQQQNKDQQKQEQKQQQKQDQQKQDQQKQDQKQQQNDAQKQTSQAQNDAGELKKAAGELGQKQMEQQAQKAQEELKKAQEAQKKGDGKKAEEHLKEAVKALGNGNGDKNDKNSGNGKNSRDPKKDKNRENGKENKDQNGQDGKKDEPQAAPAPRPQGGENPKKERKGASPAEEKRDYDRKQAEGLLELMVKDEKDLKDAMKRRMIQLQGLKKVEKDW